MTHEALTNAAPAPSCNRAIMIAGLIFLACAAIHAFLGGPEINRAVQASDAHPVVRAVSAVIWHALTALFALAGVALWRTARQPNRALNLFLLTLCLSFVALFLAIGIAELGTIFLMPQWVLFGAIAIALGFGMRRDRAA